ncbi:protein kinase family protein [Magnetospira thiophila]
MAQSPTPSRDADDNAAREKEAAPPAKGGGAAPSLLKGQYLIHHNTPLADFDCPTAKAFLAEDRREPDRALFALIVPPNLPDRAARAESLRVSGLAGVMKPVEWGPVEWPPLGQVCMVVVYAQPSGGRVMPIGESITPFQEVQVLQEVVIAPLLNTIRELHSMGFTHRALRPDNMFYADGSKKTILVGDCLTTPPGYDQPVLFETIERGMCQPAGRGIGDTREDLYALGVTLVLLLVGSNPVARYSDVELIERKISDGSYATLCGNERIPVGLLEVLRGLLSDDPVEAWGLDELQHWIDGRRQSPIQRKSAKKADRGFIFVEREYDNLRTLAHAFFLNQDAALKALKDGHVIRWVRRSLEDAEMAGYLERTLEDLEASKGNRDLAESAMIANICIALDPAAPIRYRDLSFMPEGIGPVFAAEMMKNEVAKVIQVIARGIHRNWFHAQHASSAFETRIKAMEKWLASTDLGMGPERVLYEFNFTLPCQSPLVAGRHVTDPKMLMRALDDLAKDKNPTSPPLDRHVVAFIATHLGDKAEPHLAVMADPEPARQVLGMLSLLAQVQWRTGIETLYGLTRWMGTLVGPALEAYHSRKLRREIERDIPKLVRKGSLTELYNRIEDPEARTIDKRDFELARKEFLVAEEEVNRVQSRAVDRAAMEEAAQRVAAVTAVVATLFISVMIFLSNQ